jgi:hypothetical protein
VKCPVKYPKHWELEGFRHHRTTLCIACENSPASEKGVPGNVTFSISADGTFEDIEDTSYFIYHKRTYVAAIKPTHGTKDGWTTVQVWGENFFNYADATCSFGVKSTPAFVHDSGYITCVAPSSDVVNRPMPFSISLNGQQFSDTRPGLNYTYYNEPQVTKIYPE